MPRKILSRPVKQGLLEVEVVCCLATRNCKVSPTAGVSATVLTPVSAILDIGAGSNLIREIVLPEDWERYRLPGPPEFHIVGAGGRTFLQKGNITLTVQLGTVKVQARFIVVEGLAAECILGCQFIDGQVQAILPKEKRVTFANGSVIPIIHDSCPHLAQERIRENATGVHMSNGLAESLPNQPFTIRVVKTSMKIRRLPKGMVLGHALPHQTAMVALIE
jgi:hypothetical protein